VSELADLVVYQPLRRRGFLRAVLASNAVGAPLDTIVFLALAGFPVWSALPGQLWVKAWATLIPSPTTTLPCRASAGAANCGTVTGLTAVEVSAAPDYYAAHPKHVDERITANDEAAQQPSAAGGRRAN
jgi:hypothetical protein